MRSRMLVERLLTACPEFTVLVDEPGAASTVVRAGVPGRRALVEHGGATALFIERAAAAGGVVEDAHHTRISAVCAVLGGLPLAVELAAVRLPSLGLDGVELGCWTRPDCSLVGLGRFPGIARSPRHSTGASRSLIPPAATALRRLAVMVAPFDAEDAGRSRLSRRCRPQPSVLRLPSSSNTTCSRHQRPVRGLSIACSSRCVSTALPE